MKNSPGVLEVWQKPKLRIYIKHKEQLDPEKYVFDYKGALMLGLVTPWYFTN